MSDGPSVWSPRADQDMGLSHSLDLLADTYNYNHWVYSLCRPWIRRAVLEVGAGTGNLTQFLLGVEKLICIEPEHVYHQRLEEMAGVHMNMTLIPKPLEDAPDHVRGVDTVICVNVLEHIEQDLEALRFMGSRVRRGGVVVLYVPAVQWAYGELDRHLGHYRRYTRGALRQLAQQSELSVVNMSYVNFLGLWGWWWSGRILKEALIDPEKARLMDRMVPYVSALERVLPVPLGQSLLAVMKKE